MDDSTREKPPLPAAEPAKAASSETETGAGRSRSEHGSHPRRRRRRSLRHRLANKLVYSPFLQLLIFKPWFRLAFICFVLLLAAMALLLPQVWTASPPGFEPTVSVSGLDLAQAWSLKRRGTRMEQADRPAEARYYWQAAVGNNAADPEAVRGYLRTTILGHRQPPEQLGSVIQTARWLLRLTATNQADVELVARLYSQYRLDDPLYQLLSGLPQPRSPFLERTLLKSLFDSARYGDDPGRHAEFEAHWRRVNPDETADPELGLYHAAFLAGWGPPETARDALEELVKAQGDLARAGLANRLLLAVSERRNEVESYKQALDRLSQRQEDTLLDNAGYWVLLDANGRRAEAIALVDEYNREPVNPREVVRLASIYGALGLVARARTLCEKATASYAGTPEVWLALARVLIEAKDWDELRAMALRLRQSAGVDGLLAGYSHYLEGLAEWSQSRKEPAEAAFAKAAQFGFEPSPLALQVAARLTQMGFPARADEILLRLEPQMSRQVDYWRTLLAAAYALKQGDRLLQAAERVQQLQPQDGLARNQYAAALLATRQRPAEAVTLTQGLLAEQPGSVSARLNHALALAMNQRTDEAEAVLAQLKPQSLAGDEANTYHVVRFALLVAARREAEAWQASDRIDTRRLFPAQVQWLEQERAKLPARPSTGS